VKSSSPEAFGVVKTCSIKITNKPLLNNCKLYIKFPRIKKDLPISVVFRALGCLTDKEILYYVIDNDGSEIDNIIVKIFHNSLIENENVYTELDAIKYISNHVNLTNNSFSEDIKLDYTKNIIKKDLLPHLHTDIKKLHYLGLMINKLLKYSLGLIEPSNRDSYPNKRMEVSGVLMGNLIYQGLNKISKDIKLYINKNISEDVLAIKDNRIINDLNISKIIKPNFIENILKSALATGNWGLKNTINRQGVSQVLNRLTSMSTLSHLRRISTPIDSSGKLIGPRKLQNTQWGYVCPSETPEGHSIGVVKNLSVSCEITNEIGISPILYYLNEYINPIENINLIDFNKQSSIKLFINGDIIGYIKNPN
jgi:DNA-directed RNA polymerase II subunit RPB2